MFTWRPTFLGRTGGFRRHCAGYRVPKTSTSKSPDLTKFWPEQEKWQDLSCSTNVDKDEMSNDSTYMDRLSTLSTEVLNKSKADLTTKWKPIAGCCNLHTWKLQYFQWLLHSIHCCYFDIISIYSLFHKRIGLPPFHKIHHFYRSILLPMARGQDQNCVQWGRAEASQRAFSHPVPPASVWLPMVVKTLWKCSIVNLLLQGLSSNERDVGLHFAPERPTTLHWGCVAVKVLQTKSNNS